MAKKPLECLEYVLVHEMTHLRERHHNEQFIALMARFLPQWQLMKDKINSLPLGSIGYDLDEKWTDQSAG